MKSLKVKVKVKDKVIKVNTAALLSRHKRVRDLLSGQIQQLREGSDC